MLEPHPPHAAPHTWADFFLHIATIVVGLLIAVGIEQTVEAVHRSHQRSELTEQMRVEAEHNRLPIRDSLARVEGQIEYLNALDQALLAGRPSGDFVEVTGVLPRGGSMLHISPSRATWASAQAAGIGTILPAEQEKLYARLDSNIQAEIAAEASMIEFTRTLLSECARSQFDHGSPAVQRITKTHRDNLLYALAGTITALESMARKLSIVEGGDDAIAAGVKTLEDMYPYQNAALARIPTESRLAAFYGGTSQMEYKNGSQ